MEELIEISTDLLALDDGPAYAEDSTIVAESSDSKDSDDGIRMPNGKPIPKVIPLLRIGENKYTKDGKEGCFVVTEEDADRIIEENKKRGRDLVVDHEHQTLSGQKAPAAGWISDLARTGKYIVAKVRNWNQDAKDELKNGTYRYFSPVVQFKGERPAGLHSVALTNHPSLHMPPDVLACSDASKKADFDRAVTAVENIALMLSDVWGDLESAFNKSAELATGNPELMARLAELKGKLDGSTGQTAFAEDPIKSDATAPLYQSAPVPQAQQATSPAPQAAPQEAPQENDEDMYQRLTEMQVSMSPAQFNAALEREIGSSSDPRKINILKTILKSQTPAEQEVSNTNETKEGASQMASPSATSVAETPAVVASAQPGVQPTSAQAAPAPQVAPRAFSDISVEAIVPLIGLSDKSTSQDITKRLNDMAHVCRSFNKLLGDYGVTSFGDLTHKLSEQVSKKDQEINDLKQQLVLSDYENVIDKHVREGKITEANKSIEMEALQKMGKDLYERQMATRSRIVPLDDLSYSAKFSESPKGNASVSSPSAYHEMRQLIGFDDDGKGFEPVPREVLFPTFN